MGRRAFGPDEIADLVCDHKPEGACGYFLVYKDPSGRMARQPSEDYWALFPTELPLGMFEGPLQVHYVDQQGCYMKPETPKQRLVIEYVYDPEGRGEAPSPALNQFSALADKLGSPRSSSEAPDGEDAGPELEEIEAMQGAQKQQLHLLTMDSLQTFLRDTLSHFVRIQEAATKGSQAQIEASIANMKLLSQQSTKLLESQLAAAQLTKERLEELQPQAAPPSFDLPGVLGSVLPFIQNMWMGAPGRSGGMGPGGMPRLGPPTRSGGEGEILDAEMPGSGISPSGGADRARAAVSMFREVTEPEKFERLMTDAAYLDQFVERLRGVAATEKPRASASSVEVPSAPIGVPAAPPLPVQRAAESGRAPWQGDEADDSLASLIAALTGTPRA